ncbi:single-strand DNA-binding protein [Breznakia sp. PF5-3]|uniref:single-stranded DNA-binding protein n=1 Tax=unclassified Breznakia TaxID=2623764 RepID=UPI002407766E|nr:MULTISPECIES: single-stranded DNA-binding protein [unclassified Breznakia]MDL2276869.1 single-stranded DNA-binding protein [Breznakia sp. OttesenSCG-928-G09]MDF9824781.1 single-strand DNA-binding protein [Breznakia sp. PM6-1]MDF9835763.1 single-strand DNA-binding protein [Breznakia sp. PF5-3]MDF9837849.1 single-strand DNA-binding protein [Breznakia sp. PFB2-8]MDF9859780.1 single-strand DNA-binding protein [Breznakia sp. PH5-24]
MINRVVLVGRITKDIELRKTQSGTSVVSFTMAVNRRFKQEGQPEADFIRCIAWNKTAELMNQYLNKGALIGIEGRIQTGSYQDKDGKTVYTTDVVVDNVQFLEPKNASSNNSTQTYVPQDPSGFTQQDQSSSVADDFANDTLDIASDDLPF